MRSLGHWVGHGRRSYAAVERLSRAPHPDPTVIPLPSRRKAYSRAGAALGRTAVAAHDVMINPFGHQAPRLIHRSFRMMDAIKRGAGLERHHVIRAKLAQVAICGYHRALA